MIPYINMRNPSIHNVGIGGVRNINIWTANVRDLNIPETRIWMEEPPQAVPIDVPVVVNIGNSSFVLAQSVFDRERCIATAEVISVYFDPKKQASKPLPKLVREALEKALITF